MKTLPPQHPVASTSDSPSVPVAPRRLRFNPVWGGWLCWLSAIILLLALSDRHLAAQAVRLPSPRERQSGTDSSTPWLTWQVVAQDQANTPQNLPEPDPNAAPGAAIASDGLKPLTQVTLDIQPIPGEVPPDVAAHKFAQAGRIPQPMGACRPWAPSVFWWESPALCHRPLYFEEVNLERYGYSCGVAQPLVSAAHFFGTVPAMPYLMTVNKPRECVYTLGHYVPGSCAPYRTYFPPPSLKAGVAEAAVMTGLIFVFP